MAKETEKHKEEEKADSKSKEDWFSRLINKIKKDQKLQLYLLLGLIGIIIISALLVLIIGIVTNPKQKQLFNNNNGYTNANINFNSNINAELPAVIPRRLDGSIVSRDEANKIPICVMIENAAFDGVRPQSGLQAASLVYEIIVEGGITRLMAVYAGDKTDPIGPVRSARDTYLEFASELDCMYVHAGGSYTAQLALQEMKLKDLDGLREAKYFWRDPNKNSPHNFFTKTDNLYEAIIQGHSWQDAPTYDPWLFYDSDTKHLKSEISEEATEINIEFGGSYNVQYLYNSDNQNYERWNGGAEHVDNNTDSVIKTNNIIIQRVPPGEFIEGKGRINFDVTGEGEANIFYEGTVIQGIWKKNDRLSRTKYYDKNNKEIEFRRGNTWIEIVPEGYGATWQ